MSVFNNSDGRVFIEEIVQTTEIPEEKGCSINDINENYPATVAIVEVHNSEHEEDKKNFKLGIKFEKNDVDEDLNNTVYCSHIENSSLSYNIINNNNRVVLSRNHMEQEKRMRREIANSNERRRMQSINAGFQSLRTLLPHHEGEKLSKAAILQQTAEYIYQLEQEKTHLLSQNCQLKRLLNQHEGGDMPIKKRKAEHQGVVVSLPINVNESSDEGVGSISPDPISVITVSADSHSTINTSNNVGINNEVIELKLQLEREHHQRLQIEKQLRAIQMQLYPDRYQEKPIIAYQHEILQHADNIIAPETEDVVTGLQVVSVMSIPAIGSTQTVETTDQEPSSPPLSPQPIELVADEIIKEEDSCPDSRKIVAFSTSNQVFTTIEDHGNTECFSPIQVPYKNEFTNSATSFTAKSPTRSFSPPTEPQRLPSVLEAAMKAEPKVEVERLPSPASSLEEGTSQARLYLANTSRQNLETIVEAIRHLEGDHLFSDEPTQDVPLALTNKPTASSQTSTLNKQRLLHTEVNNILHFQTQQQTQQRPGVIVVKHS
ncbi:uncharacterized protein crp [Chelonus insularis]|uniref:uncharacterized protein crp n=1 Tax=Chelonus insularis TaxID=460826 RepID=UPI00158C4D45|nr:uncharacterized protein LOC118065300 [Chelonus insularis]